MLTSNTTQSTSSYGRVVSLHFACRISLPIGSSLRVTSSHLWTPDTLSAHDPTSAKAPDETPVSLGEEICAASSVEMVTSPEEWPVWRTRTPVVLFLGHKHGTIQHHRYRYFVVAPSCDAHLIGEFKRPLTLKCRTESGFGKGLVSRHSSVDCVLESLESEDSDKAGFGERNPEGNSRREVIIWENPFKDSDSELQAASSLSVPSLRRNIIVKNEVNTAYRTLDIDNVSAEVVRINDEGKDSNEEHELTSNGVCIDTWNHGEDHSFRPFIERDNINKQNKIKKQQLSRLKLSISDSDFSNLTPGNRTPSGGSLASTTPMGVDQKDEENPINNLSDIRGKKDRIFFVCFHLPVILSKDHDNSKWSACWAESLLAKTDSSYVVQRHETHWVGTVSSANHPIATEEDRAAVTAVLGEMNCTPLFLEEDVIEAHYMGMCKQVLWPAFHNIDLLDLSSSGWIPPGSKSTSRSNNTNEFESASVGSPSSYATSKMESDWDQSRLDGWWNAYLQVNTAFAETLSSMLRPGDIMWVHDYHLSLLPKLVDEKEFITYSGQSVTKKVFFLHIPFPTSQIFRELECGDSILEGMLHCDVIGFHAFDHTRHFLNAAKRILGLTYESLVGGLIGLQYKRRTVLVTMHNVSVEPAMVNAALTLPSVREGSTLLQNKYSGRKVIAGIDIAQRLSGISLKLLAFERFLNDYPVWQEKVVLVQKCLIPGSRRADENNTIQEVRHLVRRIEGKFGKYVIDVEEIVGSSLPIDQRLALWTISDVLMATPIREGLNLLPMEYIFTKKKPATPGVVISSEFSAVSSILNGALRVNPFDIQMTVGNIDTALTMNANEKEGRRVRDAKFVTSSPSNKWTLKVLRDLNDATAVMSSNGYDSDDTNSLKIGSEKIDIVTSTGAFLAQEYERDFSRLDQDAVVDAYKASKRRVIIFDLNGTIVPKEPPGKYFKRDMFGTSGHKPPIMVCQALSTLCEDPNNTVFVVSGDSQENITDSVGNIRNLGLAASNGACFSNPVENGERERSWKYFDLGVDWEAVKRIVVPILSKYTARSNGSFVKLTHSSIGWSYYSCDPEWGSLQASHLVLELEHALRPFAVRFVMIKGIVEIMPRLLNKGLIVKKVLKEVAKRDGNAGVDFILCMGDDVQDEKMFTSVFSFIAESEDIDYTITSPNEEESDMRHIPQDLVQSSVECPVMNSSKGPVYAFTTVVGKKTSHASTFVESQAEVTSLLGKLTDVGQHQNVLGLLN